MKADCPPESLIRAEALRLLHSRYSTSPKYLREPGPSDAQLLIIAQAALRAPDHGKLTPFSFVVLRDKGLERLAELFADYGQRRGKSGEELEAERKRAMQAPVVLAVVARIQASNEKVPVHEQWACVGGAISNAVTALHAMGFGAKMLSGERAADAAIGKAFCEEGETLVGWISTGTGAVAPKPRDPIEPHAVLRRFEGLRRE